ncbi:hypothetical protein LCGC14_0895510 [marine sediment metagenome]|uniref:Fibronectin type-III domain-containing protein n=1 Tax=marine sediment metagenome TaxID=412755 RepID=A0A0F9S4Y2_9ZZZZ
MRGIKISRLKKVLGFGLGFFIVGYIMLNAMYAWGASPVKLSWDPVVEESLSGYRVYYSEVSGGYTASITVSPAVTELMLKDVPGLKPGRDYYFVVVAFNDMVESDYSNEVSVNPTMPTTVLRLE